MLITGRRHQWCQCFHPCLFPDPTAMVELWKESPQGLVKEGDTVELRCQGDGSPPPSFIFNREQVRMHERGREREW